MKNKSVLIVKTFKQNTTNIKLQQINMIFFKISHFVVQ